MSTDPLSPAELSEVRAAVDVLRGQRWVANGMRLVAVESAGLDAPDWTTPFAIVDRNYLNADERSVMQHLAAILNAAPSLIAMAEAATQHRCPVAWDQPNSDPIVSAEGQPLWVEYRERWLKKGYDIHAYHGFKAGPLPGCNTMYGDTQCNASIDEHCHCGSGEHLALDSEQSDAPAPAAPGTDGSE